MLAGEFTDPALLAQLAARCAVLSFDWENIQCRHCGPRRAPRAAGTAPAFPAVGRAGRLTGPVGREAHVRAPGARDHALRAGRLARRARARGRAHRPARHAQDAASRLRRQGPDVLRAAADLDPAWQQLGGAPLLYEEFVPFDYEVSIIGARARDGSIAVYPLNRNYHEAGILRLTSGAVARARACARRAAHRADGACSGVQLRRGTGDRVLRAPWAADRERDGAARAQFRPLDHRGRRDQPVREPSSARSPGCRSGDTGARGHAAMINLIGAAARHARAAGRARAAPALLRQGAARRPQARPLHPDRDPAPHAAMRAPHSCCDGSHRSWLSGRSILHRPHVPRTLQAAGTAVPAQRRTRSSCT